LGGINFSGHDTTARLVLRKGEFAKTTARPRTKIANVVGDFHERYGEDVECTVGLNKGVMCGESFKLNGLV
jgi:hypothetical protein